MFGGQQSSSPSQGTLNLPLYARKVWNILIFCYHIWGLLGIRLTFITQSDQSKFESLFSRAIAGTGSQNLSGNVSRERKVKGDIYNQFFAYDYQHYIIADAARNILMRSQIDNNTLAQIWYGPLGLIRDIVYYCLLTES
jgi:hypothetical protein